MHINDAAFVEDLRPKLRLRFWRKCIHLFEGKSFIYCRKSSESIHHILAPIQGGLNITEDCVPACLLCNGKNQMSMFFL